MKKPLVYKIYYLDEEVTVVTKSTMDGDYIVVDKDTFTQVAFSPSAYKIVDNKLIKKPIEYVTEKPQWYDNKKHSIVNKYD